MAGIEVGPDVGPGDSSHETTCATLLVCLVLCLDFFILVVLFMAWFGDSIYITPFVSFLVEAKVSVGNAL